MNLRPRLLPHLLYLGDTPVESSYHGSLLLYRLLEQYPTDRLLIGETGLFSTSRLERRIPQAKYVRIKLGWGRLLRTRFSRSYRSWLVLAARFRSFAVKRAIKGFMPEAVVSVTQEPSWITAHAYASSEGIPFHLVLHDDWIACGPALGPANQLLRRDFSRIYRTADSRLCVSPYMEEHFRREYGVSGNVLYPCRGQDCPQYAEPPDHLQADGRPFTMAYGGNLFLADYARTLLEISRILEGIGGRLLVFGPFDEATVAGVGLRRENVVFKALLPPNEFLAAIRTQADALVVPMSFRPEDAMNMRLSFPSKMTDYTAAGLPLLVCGPPYSSIVRWARENPGCAVVCGSPLPDQLKRVVLELATDKNLRLALGKAALDVGSQFFSLERGFEIFSAALSGSLRANSPAPGKGSA